MKDTTGAFPFGTVSYGMHLRDYFAAAALQGILASPIIFNQVEVREDLWAKIAYEWADAMMQARGL